MGSKGKGEWRKGGREKEIEGGKLGRGRWSKRVGIGKIGGVGRGEWKERERRGRVNIHTWG